MVKKAYIFKEDAGQVAAELKGGLKQVSSQGIVAAGKTAKDAAGAASGATKSAKSGLGSQASSAIVLRRVDRGRRVEGRVGVAGSVSTQVKSTATAAATTGNHTVTQYGDARSRPASARSSRSSAPA